MRIIFIRKNVFTVLFVLFIFIGANIVLLFKFMSRRNIELQLSSRTNIQSHGNTEDLSKSNEKMFEKNEENFITMDMKRKDDIGSKVGDPHMDKQEIQNKESKTLEKEDDKLSEQIDKQPEKESKLKLKDEKQLQLEDEKVNKQNDKQSSQNYKFVILVIACNRPTVKRCLDKLLQYRPSAEVFPILVSQDCGHQKTANVIRSYGDKVQFIQQPDLGPVQGVPSKMIHFMGYYKISRHFKFALTQAFDVFNYETVIIVEDDLDIAPDFYDYFSATRPLLSKDPTLWCVSAWNDNGKRGMVQGNDILYRTDFFPGLGWMLTKQIWNEFKGKWPLGFWDDWVREPAQHKKRACIRPEISRTRTFGKVGVSRGQFFDQHLKYIQLNEESYPFSHTDLSYLLKENYDQQFKNTISKLPTITFEKLKSSGLKEVKIFYSSKREFETLARLLGAMHDFKAGIARASYKGVVVVIYKGVRVYLTPEDFLNST